LQQGNEAFAQGDYNTAERCFTQVLRQHRDWAELYGKLGAIYHKRGRFTDAVKLYAHALEINPKYLEARLNLAVLLCDLGRYDHAAKLLSPLKKTTPFPGRLNMIRLADRHIATGDAYYQLQLYDHARVEFEHAAKLRPGWPDLRRKLGIVYRRLRRCADAIRELEAARAADPKDLDLQTELALSYYQAGQKDKAQALWRAVLAHDPNHGWAQRYLLLAQTGNEEIAQA
jgi:tetratricopeptide (TPR) repeat protein